MAGMGAPPLEGVDRTEFVTEPVSDWPGADGDLSRPRRLPDQGVA